MQTVRGQRQAKYSQAGRRGTARWRRHRGTRQRWLHLLLAAVVALAALAAPAAAQAAPAPRPGTWPVLHLDLDAEPHVVDAQRAVTPAEIALIRQLYEPLLRFDTTLWPQPGLAERYQMSADGKVWTFTLRPNARWSDGEPVTAAQVRDGWLRMMTREIPEELTRPFRIVRGAGFFRVDLIVDPRFVGLRALDDRTLEITLEDPAPQIVMIAALPGGSPFRADVVPPTGERVKGEPDRPLHVGNGPFQLTEWHRGEVLRLEPNPHYWQGPPKVALALHLPGSQQPASGEAALARFLAGERDLVVVPPEAAAGILGNVPEGAHLLRQPLPQTTWLSLNTKRKPLDSAPLRHALSYAINRRALIADALGGIGQPAYSLLPPGVPGHDPGAWRGRQANAEAARALILAAGWRVPWSRQFFKDALPRLTLRHPNLPRPTRLAAAIRDQLLLSLGIWLKLDPLDPIQYAYALERKDFDLALSGWRSPYPDPEAWFWLTFGTDKVENRTGWGSEAYDRLWQLAEDMPTREERLSVYRIAQDLLWQETPAIFLIHDQRLVLVRDGIEGIEPALMDDLPGAATLYRATVVGSQ